MLQQLTCEKCQKTFGSLGGWRYHTSHNVCEAKPTEISAEAEEEEEEEPQANENKVGRL